MFDTPGVIKSRLLNSKNQGKSCGKAEKILIRYYINKLYPIYQNYLLWVYLPTS